MEVSDQLHTPAALLPGKGARYPLDGKLGGLQSRSGRCGVEENFLSLPGIEPWSFLPNAFPNYHSPVIHSFDNIQLLKTLNIPYIHKKIHSKQTLLYLMKMLRTPLHIQERYGRPITEKPDRTYLLRCNHCTMSTDKITSCFLTGNKSSRLHIRGESGIRHCLVHFAWCKRSIQPPTPLLVRAQWDYCQQNKRQSCTTKH
jgi:hypothetical protein